MTELDALYAQLPHLANSPHRITSSATDAYNCVAWVERDLDRWWEPGFYWPTGVPQPAGESDLDIYVELFKSLGFEVCEDGELEDEFLKIALYGVAGIFHHVAKQLPSGAWSSKAGSLHDLRHEHLEAFEDAPLLERARPLIYMRRARDQSDSFELEERGLVRLA